MWTTNQIIDLLDTILNHNYLSFLGQIYTPEQGVALGSPISGTITEIFLQVIGKSILKHLIDNRILPFYTRYVDDIFLHL
jgi:hypothetical protein